MVRERPPGETFAERNVNTARGHPAVRQKATVNMTSGSDTSSAKIPLLLGSSRAIQMVRYFIGQVGPSDASCLVTGPSGSGKEVVANLLHGSSRRAAAPFVTLNCGAISADLIESELFGHEKGAFTGAISKRIGRFEAVDKGTLFLDEIGDMPLGMQVKLLRVLEERRFERVGSSASRNVDTRVISATHRTLETAIAEGSFREDLFYRINIFPIHLPALRERQEDVAELLAHFACQFGDKEPAFTLDAASETLLCEYEWPGNVRELRNFAERAAILHRGRKMAATEAGFLLSLGRARAQASSAVPAGCLTQVAAPSPALRPQEAAEDTSNVLRFPARLDDGADPAATTALNPADMIARGGLNLRDLLASIEQSFIASALDQCDYTVADAARLLGLQRTTLCEKMRKYDIRRAPDIQQIAFA